MSKELSPKQRKFVAEYLKDGNGTQAAIRAGYSTKTANEQAARLLAKASVKGAVEGRLEKLELTADYVLGGIRKIADHGEEEHNRLKAFELLGKRLKLFTEKIEHSFDGLTDEQLEARYQEITSSTSVARSPQEAGE